MDLVCACLTPGYRDAVESHLLRRSVNHALALASEDGVLELVEPMLPALHLRGPATGHARPRRACQPGFKTRRIDLEPPRSRGLGVRARVS
jgi:hypothetical protein